MSMVSIVIFNSVDDLLSMKFNHGLIPYIFKFLVNSVKSRITPLSLLFFTSVVRI